jgi:hypothetical protein
VECDQVLALVPWSHDSNLIKVQLMDGCSNSERTLFRESHMHLNGVPVLGSSDAANNRKLFNSYFLTLTDDSDCAFDSALQ